MVEMAISAAKEKETFELVSVASAATPRILGNVSYILTNPLNQLYPLTRFIYNRTTFPADHFRQGSDATGTDYTSRIRIRRAPPPLYASRRLQISSLSSYLQATHLFQSCQHA